MLSPQNKHDTRTRRTTEDQTRRTRDLRKGGIKGILFSRFANLFFVADLVSMKAGVSLCPGLSPPDTNISGQIRGATH